MPSWLVRSFRSHRFGPPAAVGNSAPMVAAVDPARLSTELDDPGAGSQLKWRPFGPG